MSVTPTAFLSGTFDASDDPTSCALIRLTPAVARAALRMRMTLRILADSAAPAPRLEAPHLHVTAPAGLVTFYHDRDALDDALVSPALRTAFDAALAGGEAQVTPLDPDDASALEQQLTFPANAQLATAPLLEASAEGIVCSVRAYDGATVNTARLPWDILEALATADRPTQPPVAPPTPAELLAWVEAEAARDTQYATWYDGTTQAEDAAARAARFTALAALLTPHVSRA